MSGRTLVGAHDSRADSWHSLRAQSHFAETGRGRTPRLSEAARANSPHARRPCYSGMSACLDFLGLKDESIENALEPAILRELERFLLELGTDHAFTWPRLPLKRKNEKRPSVMLRSWDMRDCRSIIARAGSRPIQWEGTALGISRAPIVWISADGPTSGLGCRSCDRIMTSRLPTAFASITPPIAGVLSEA